MKLNTSMRKFQHAIIPPSPLRWFDIPLFHINFFSPEFSGRLYFILGQGLGDHVNGFRILIEIKKRFPQALCIIYADLRWKDLVERLKNVEIRWYPKAKDILSKEGTNNPYDLAREEVRKEIANSNGEAFLAYAHFPMPDRHARQESTLEATARTIGLVLGRDARPYLPLSSTDVQWALDFLTRNNLKRNEYAVISPLSWPNKMWRKENFSSIIDRLYQNYGLRTIITSYPEIGPFTNKGAVCAYNLSLGQLAGLLSLAGVYVGLDSGPSHMCAFFDTPMLVLYIEKKVIPFEVRTLSPHSLLLVESFFTSEKFPAVETAFNSLKFLLELKNNKNEEIPECLACGRRMDHVVATDGLKIRLMCPCGLVYDRRILKTESESIVQIRKEARENHVPKKPLNLKDPLQIEDILENEAILKHKSPVTFSVTLSPIDQKNSELTPGNFMWGFDSLIYWMGKKGYLPVECSWDHGKMLVKFSTSSDPERDRLMFPWGKKKIITSVSRYLRWYTFSRWSDPKILVGIVKSMTELNLSRRERFSCSIDSFRTEPGLRSFRWIIKSLF